MRTQHVESRLFLICRTRHDLAAAFSQKLATLSNFQLTGLFFSIGLMVNRLLVNDNVFISLQGKPTLGVSLKEFQNNKESSIAFHL